MNNRNKNQGEFNFLSETIQNFFNRNEFHFDHFLSILLFLLHDIVFFFIFIFFFTLLLFYHTEHSPQFVFMSKLYPTLGQEKN